MGNEIDTNAVLLPFWVLIESSETVLKHVSSTHNFGSLIDADYGTLTEYLFCIQNEFET